MLDLAPETVPSMLAELDGAEPADVVRFAHDLFGDELTLACSAQDMVLVDVASRVAPGLRVFTIDTGYLFHETEETVRRAVRRYPQLRFEVVRPRDGIGAHVGAHGTALYRRDPDTCCALRKLEPMERALSGYRAWVTGIRRDQSPTRADVTPVAWDVRWNMVKFAPLAVWTSEQIWTYARLHGVPYNRLHDRGYPSIGCAPCTERPLDGDTRSGRWAGQDKLECGLHSPCTEVQ